MRAVFWGLVILLSPLSTLADSVPMSDEEFSLVRTEVNRWANEQDVFVGPTLAEDIAIQALQASTYLCFTADARCDKFKDRATQRKVIGTYLSDLLANPATMTGLMSRLFTAVGASLTNIGWPDGSWFNRYVVVARPVALSPVSQTFYVHWNNSEAVPAQRGKLVLPLGLHTFYAQGPDGSATELVVRAARQTGGAVLLTVVQRTIDAGHRLAAAPSRIEPQLDRYCLDKPVDPAEPMYRVATGRGPTPQNAMSPSDFHAADVVDIALSNSPNGCDLVCQRWIGVEIIQALSQWRAGCAGCLPSTLSVVRVAGDLYVADRFVNWAQFVAESLGADPKSNPYRIAELLTAGGGINATMGFQRVQNTPVLGILCAAAPAEDALSVNARNRICGAAAGACSSTTGCLSIPVTLTGTSDCKGFLACGSPDHSVSVNTSEFQFTAFPGDNRGAYDILIGTLSTLQHGVPVPLYPVLLHEVGHWFGLPHVDSDVGPDGRDEVMRATGGTDKVCISRAALNMVSNAVDRNWQFRLKVRGGLHYAPN